MKRWPMSLTWILMLLLLGLSSLEGCQTTAASTPMFGPFEQIKVEELKRIVVPDYPDDSEAVTTTLGEMRQAISESDQLDAILPVANASQRDLYRVIESNNSLYDLYSRQKATIELVAGLGVVGTILAFMLGHSL